MRKPRVIGRRRNVHVRDLRVGLILLGPIRGRGGNILVQEGEVLSQKHVDQIQTWEKRPGEGRLSLYTRTVWAQMTDASGDERPACDFDPYQAISVQKNWKRSMGHAIATPKPLGAHHQEAA